MIKDAASTLPSTAFFSYGTNDMGMYSGDSKAFTEKYREIIEQFKEISPDTEIYVNSIPKPSDSKISSGGYFYKWEDFNLDIKQMCDAIDAEYIDTVSYTHLRAHETGRNLVCRLLLEKKKKKKKNKV